MDLGVTGTFTNAKESTVHDDMPGVIGILQLAEFESTQFTIACISGDGRGSSVVDDDDIIHSRNTVEIPVGSGVEITLIGRPSEEALRMCRGAYSQGQAQ